MLPDANMTQLRVRILFFEVEVGVFEFNKARTSHYAAAIVAACVCALKLAYISNENPRVRVRFQDEHRLNSDIGF